MPRKIYKKTLENWEKEERARKEREYERAKLQLGEEDVEWKPLHVNNILSNSIEGYYTFLFKKQADGSISGYKWTVVFQPEESGYGWMKNPVTIEAYNLYFKEYRNVAGVLGYREPGYTYEQCYLKSTIHDGVHSYGKFVRSYKTFELAKGAALYWNGTIGWGNVDKNNIIRVSLDEKRIAEMERDFEAKMPGTEQEKDIYVLILWECFGEYSICGVYTSQLKLIDGYQKIMEENVKYSPFTDSFRKPAVYKFHVNEFLGEMPEWNDGRLFFDDQKHEISIQELQEEAEIYEGWNADKEVDVLPEAQSVSYFLIRGYDEFHDGDEWIGIYDNLSQLKRAYETAVRELEKEHQNFDDGDNWTARHEKIMINIFNKRTGKWRYDIPYEILFPDMPTGSNI